MADTNSNENERLFRTLFEECPLAVLLVDGQGVVKEANPQMEVLSRYPSDALIGKKYWEYGFSGNISFTEKRLQLAIKKKMLRIQFESPTVAVHRFLGVASLPLHVAEVVHAGEVGGEHRALPSFTLS